MPPFDPLIDGHPKESHHAQMTREAAEAGIGQMARLTVVDFGNARDVPAQMEAAAAEIRALGDQPKSAVCVVYGADNAVTVFGWGDADAVRSLGLLQMGIGELMRQMGGGS